MAKAGALGRMAARGSGPDAIVPGCRGEAGDRGASVVVVVTGAAVAALQSWSGKPLSKLLAAATGSEYAVGYVLHAVAAVVAIAYLVHLARSAIGPREDRV